MPQSYQQGQSLEDSTVNVTLSWSASGNGPMDGVVNVRGSQTATVPLAQVEQFIQQKSQSLQQQAMQDIGEALSRAQQGQHQGGSAQSLIQQFQSYGQGQQRRTA